MEVVEEKETNVDEKEVENSTLERMSEVNKEREVEVFSSSYLGNLISLIMDRKKMIAKIAKLDWAMRKVN